MKRVLCLYRVSTLKQVDKQDDIPMQRRECLDFINRMDDWKFYDERMEKGVAGYKVSANDRDIIVEIREMAEQKQFDVLLVFMFDRLGRKEDETPFLVKWCECQRIFEPSGKQYLSHFCERILEPPRVKMTANT